MEGWREGRGRWRGGAGGGGVEQGVEGVGWRGGGWRGGGGGGEERVEGWRSGGVLGSGGWWGGEGGGEVRVERWREEAGGGCLRFLFLFSEGFVAKYPCLSLSVTTLLIEMAAQACYKPNVFDSLPYTHTYVCIYIYMCTNRLTNANSAAKMWSVSRRCTSLGLGL